MTDTATVCLLVLSYVAMVCGLGTPPVVTAIAPTFGRGRRSRDSLTQKRKPAGRYAACLLATGLSAIAHVFMTLPWLIRATLARTVALLTGYNGQSAPLIEMCQAEDYLPLDGGGHVGLRPW